jgi:hypothetical protein
MKAKGRKNNDHVWSYVKQPELGRHVNNNALEKDDPLEKMC